MTRSSAVRLVLPLAVLAGTAGMASACSGSAGVPVTTDSLAAPKSTGKVAVYPFPGSHTSLPATSIAFRDVSPSAIGTVQVRGSQTGVHTGHLRADSDQHGADFYPTKPFRSGEQVTVSTGLDLVGVGGGTYSFTIATPVTDNAAPRQERDDPSQDQRFVSAPNLVPPKVYVDRGSLADSGGSVFLGPKGGPGQDGPMIIDSHAQLQWFKPLPDNLQAFNVRTQRYRGVPVLTWWQGYLTTSGHGQGTDVIYDDHYRKIATIAAGNGLQADHHEFTISADNTALITSYRAMQWNTTSVGGSKDGVAVDGIVQEIDIPTGNVLFEWHALDHVPITDSLRKYDPLWDFFHVNSIQDLPHGQLLVGAKDMHQAYEIDKATGHIVWRLGGKHSDFTGNGNVFNSQHHIRLHGSSTLTIFDNAKSIGPTVESRSRAMVVALDFAKRTATVTLSIYPDKFDYALNQGSVQIEYTGNYFVGWGSQPYAAEYGPKGGLRWEAHLPTGDASYRAFRSPWTGHPDGGPAIAAARSGDTTTVHTSWNGATAVAAYRVLAGSDPSDLHRVAHADRTGFETAIRVPAGYAYVQISAFDADDQLLAKSAAVQPS